MNCPYCMEEIKDDAIACRFCKRDLIFMLPIARRIAALEAKVEELCGALSSMKQNNQGTAIHGTFWNIQQRADRTSSARRVIEFSVLVIVSSFLLGFLTNRLMRSDLAMTNMEFATSLVLAYAALSSLIGYIAPTALKFMVIGALAQPFLTILALLAIEYGPVTLSSSWMPPPSTTEAFHEFLPIFKHVFAWTCLLFFSGTWLGGWTNKALHRGSQANDVKTNFTNSLFTQRGSETSEDFDLRVKRWSSVISGAAPILTFLASLITAEFSYLGAISKVGR